MTRRPRKVVLAYSGGLDTSIIVAWLIERYGCEVVTYTGDVGQQESLDGLEAKALASGASQAIIEDLRLEFVRDYVWPALRAGAIYEGRYLLGTALARPVLALHQVKAAQQVGADAVAHGCTGKGNDQLRFELVYRAVAPNLEIIAPWREWDIRSREDALAFAERRGISVPVSQGSLYSRDGNLWHLSHEGGWLEDPWCSPPANLYQITVDPVAAPDQPHELVLTFDAGLPVAIDGRDLEPHPLLEELNRTAGAHGIGRVDMVENRVVGLKSRGVYETPGGTVLMAALRDLEGITLDAPALRERARAGEVLADLTYRGLWFTPVREALEALVARLMDPVTGDVRVELYKGAVRCLGRRSPHSLYDADLSTFGAAGGYNQSDASGFIRLCALPLAAEANRGSTEAESVELSGLGATESMMAGSVAGDSAAADSVAAADSLSAGRGLK